MSGGGLVGIEVVGEREGRMRVRVVGVGAHPRTRQQLGDLEEGEDVEE